MTIATFPIAHRGFGLIEFETDKRLLWVINGPAALEIRLPFYPQKRTFESTIYVNDRFAPTD